MAAKRKRSSRRGGAAKKSRNVMTLAKKIVILDRLRVGESVMSLSRHFNVNESSIRAIRSREENIRASVKASRSESAKVCRLSRKHRFFERLEKLLSVWISSQSNEKGCAVDGLAIREKALNLSQHLRGGAECEFKASKGWLSNFVRRFGLHSVKLQGEAGSTTTTLIYVAPSTLDGISGRSADQEAAEKFKPAFLKFIEERDYVADQVFNANETGLFYKSMGCRTYISKEQRVAPGFKAVKDRLTLLFCGNASGDFKCKPLLVYRAQNPRALKGKSKSHLPVVWRANRKARVTRILFEDWLVNCFVPEVKEYLAEKKLASTILLILDNAPGCTYTSETIAFTHPDVKIMFLPANTASILQPMDQGVIKTFKSYYIRSVFRRATHFIDAGTSENLRTFWRAYNIKDCIDVIKGSWDEVRSSTLNACWNQLWPDIVSDFKGFPTVKTQVADIVKLANELGGEGFADMREDHVEELLQSHEEELMNEEMDDLIASASSDNEDAEEKGEPAKPIFSSSRLSEFLHKANKLADSSLEMDPIMERSLKFKRGLDSLLEPYKELMKDFRRKAKQQKITSFDQPASLSHQSSTENLIAAASSRPSTSTEFEANDSSSTDCYESGKSDELGERARD